MKKISYFLCFYFDISRILIYFATVTEKCNATNVRNILNICNMNSQLAIISHPEFGEVRNVMIKGEPWFVAKDVCEILGHTNPSMAISLLEEMNGVRKV